jgi:outer membrane lipoprotein SlyB
MLGKALAAVAALLILAGCQHPSQNVYGASEVGKASLVNFGTVVAVREVAITGDNTGIGAAAGAAAGGVAGSQFGRGGGSAAATLVGVLVGAAIGAVAEQAAADRTGLEYTVTLENGVTMTVVQEKTSAERALQPGERIMLQVSGGFQRVLPADHLPTEIKRPQGIKVVD